MLNQRSTHHASSASLERGISPISRQVLESERLLPNLTVKAVVGAHRRGQRDGTRPDMLPVRRARTYDGVVSPSARVAAESC